MFPPTPSHTILNVPEMFSSLIGHFYPFVLSNLDQCFDFDFILGSDIKGEFRHKGANLF